MPLAKALLAALLFVMSGWTCGIDDEASTAASTHEAAPAFDTDDVVGRWVSMWNTHDLSLVDSLFLTVDRLTYFSSEKEGLIQGIEAVREHHVGFGFVKGGKEQENALWLEDLQTQSFGDAVAVEGVWFFRAASGDSTTTQKGPVTFVYVLDGHDYRIAHVHFANY